MQHYLTHSKSVQNHWHELFSCLPCLPIHSQGWGSCRDSRPNPGRLQVDMEDLEPKGGLALKGGTKEYPLYRSSFALFQVLPVLP